MKAFARVLASLALACAPVVASAGAAGAPTAIGGPAQPSAPAVRGMRPASNTISGCRLFPADNAWNAPVAGLPVLANSSAIIARLQSIGRQNLWPGFVSNSPYGFPFRIVGPTQPSVPVRYVGYPAESDPGPFPIPLDAPIETGSTDHHVIVLQTGTCRLFELWDAAREGSGWRAGTGAVFDLTSNTLRPDGWTAADAAGLPILPGLVRCADMEAGVIAHPIRVTFTQTRRAYVHPATHVGTNPDANLPAMGARLRLRASFDTSRFTGQSRILVEALKTYGLIVSDNGPNWSMSGELADCWDNTNLDQIRNGVSGWDFEVVDTGTIHT